MKQRFPSLTPGFSPVISARCGCQLIEFYQHKEGVNWANRMILGDSLLVMNSLAEKEGLKGQ